MSKIQIRTTMYIAFLIFIFAIICAFYYVFIYKEKFERSVGGVFLASDFEEKYSVINTVIEVDKIKYDKLHIYHSINLLNGSLIFELYNPKNELINSRQIDKNDFFSEISVYIPIKGNWRIKYYINSATEGNYSLSLSSN